MSDVVGETVRVQLLPLVYPLTIQQTIVIQSDTKQTWSVAQHRRFLLLLQSEICYLSRGGLALAICHPSRGGLVLVICHLSRGGLALVICHPSQGGLALAVCVYYKLGNSLSGN